MLLILLAIAGGFCIGLLCIGGIVTPKQNTALAVNGTLSSAPLPLPDTSTPSAEPLDTSDDALLLERADALLCAMRDGDYKTLSSAVHPEKGVRLTPYSSVDPECDQVLTSHQIARLAKDETVYTWGVIDGRGDPIRLTIKEYFARYVFNADYTTAPQVALDEVQCFGNAIENASDAYPEGRFVEYHFPGLDQTLEGFDWCSLKLVFEPYQDTWYLVGLIHSEWTV